MTWEIRRLERGDDRSQFDCGIAELSSWLQKIALQHERRDLARTYVATLPGDPRVLGYYAIASHRVKFETLPPIQAKGLPRIDLPVVLLGKLAVDNTMKGKGLGATLLIDAMRRVNHISDQLGIRALEVDAIDDGARSFYLKYGFVPLLDDRRHWPCKKHCVS